MKKINFENLYNSTVSRLLIADIIIKLLSYVTVQIASTGQLSLQIILQYGFFAVMTECATGVLVAGILFLVKALLKVKYDFSFAVKITAIALIFNNVCSIILYALGMFIPMNVWVRHSIAAAVSAAVAGKGYHDHFPKMERGRMVALLIIVLAGMIFFRF